MDADVKLALQRISCFVLEGKVKALPKIVLLLQGNNLSGTSNGNPWEAVHSMHHCVNGVIGQRIVHEVKVKVESCTANVLCQGSHGHAALDRDLRVETSLGKGLEDNVLR